MNIKTKDYFKPNCKYADKCKSKGTKCCSCKHNEKDDFYEPKHFPWNPARPMPWYPDKDEPMPVPMRPMYHYWCEC